MYVTSFYIFYGMKSTQSYNIRGLSKLKDSRQRPRAFRNVLGIQSFLSGRFSKHPLATCYFSRYILLRISQVVNVVKLFIKGLVRATKCTQRIN